MYIVRDTDRGKYPFFKAKVVIFFFFFNLRNTL